MTTTHNPNGSVRNPPESEVDLEIGLAESAYGDLDRKQNCLG